MTSLNITKKRLIGEIKNLEKNREPYYQVIQDSNDIFKFYFMIKGDDATDYKGGYYIGTIILPPNYPAMPGDFYMLTPNGRFEIDSKICLTNTGYHRENWTPMWNIQNMVIGFISIFTSDDTEGISHILESSEKRRLLASQSIQYNKQYINDIFIRFNQFVNPDQSIRSNDEVIRIINASKIKKKKNIPKNNDIPTTPSPNNIPIVPPNTPNYIPDIRQSNMEEIDITKPEQQVPKNYDEWIQYVRTSNINTFDEKIFTMKFI